MPWAICPLRSLFGLMDARPKRHMAPIHALAVAVKPMKKYTNMAAAPTTYQVNQNMFQEHGTLAGSRRLPSQTNVALTVHGGPL